MRFLAPLIAAVALSGCSNNDKTQKPTATPLIPKDGGKPPVVPESAEDPVKQACACNHKHCGGNPEKKNEMGKMPPVIPAPKDAAILIVANQSEDPIPQQQPVHNIAARQAGNFSAQPQAVVIVENHTTHATQPQTAVIVENHPTEDAQTMDINNTIANRTAVVIPQQQPVNVIAATLTTNVAQPQAVVIDENQTQQQAINDTVANETAVVISQSQNHVIDANATAEPIAQQQYDVIVANGSADPIARENCPICQDEMKETEELLELSCGHPFHANCILRNFERNEKICPLCRAIPRNSEICEPVYAWRGVGLCC